MSQMSPFGDTCVPGLAGSRCLLSLRLSSPCASCLIVLIAVFIEVELSFHLSESVSCRVKGFYLYAENFKVGK